MVSRGYGKQPSGVKVDSVFGGGNGHKKLLQPVDKVLMALDLRKRSSTF